MFRRVTCYRLQYNIISNSSPRMFVSRHNNIIRGKKKKKIRLHKIITVTNVCLGLGRDRTWPRWQPVHLSGNNANSFCFNRRQRVTTGRHPPLKGADDQIGRSDVSPMNIFYNGINTLLLLFRRK